MRNAFQVLDNQFVQLLLDAIGDGVFTLDREGYITSWNPSMERITGYRADSVLGRKCAILGFDSCFGQQCPADCTECGLFKYGRVEPTECAIRHKDGHFVPVIKNARVIRDEKRSVIGAVETVTDLTELKMARSKVEEASRRLRESHKFGNIIGKSQAMQRVFSAMAAAAVSETTLLILGESGTGKELVANAIHYNGSRRNKPLMIVNCSALPESLLESELFGYVKGAFTGAAHDRAGRFEEADGGTVFLDEIGEISPLIQVKLLRVLQEKQIERVGESKTRKIDIRIIAASNKDLYELMQRGLFREDLYYRLKVFPIYMPALRNRKEDIPLLVNHFIENLNQKTGKQIKSVSAAGMRACMNYSWPGNVRELENAIEHAFVLSTGNPIGPPDLPPEVLHPEFKSPFREHSRIWRQKGGAGQNLTRDDLLALLTDHGWNKAEVSRRTGLSRAAIWKYMKKWNIPLRAI
jgi:PAS domain S-box-containing protein